MKNTQISTLFVGIDVSSKSNVVCGIDFYGNKLLNLSAPYNHRGAITISNEIISCLNSNKLDFVVITDFARVGCISSKPWRGSQHLDLQRHSRLRLHLIEFMTRKKTYMVSNIYLKFIELAVLNKDDKPLYLNINTKEHSHLQIVN